MFDTVEIIGLIAGVFTSIGFAPQLIKILKTNSTKDISIAMYLVLCVGFCLWIVYGIFHGAISIILANIVSLSLSALILTLKVRIEREAK